MYYVYTLSFNGIPFYAGYTNNPVQRFRGHYFWSDCLTYNFVRYNLITFNRLATMDLIACHEDRTEAGKIEAQTIRFLSLAGFVLLNKDYNSVDMRLYPPIYPPIKRLPHRWFTATTRHIITVKQEKIKAEYEQG